MAICCMAIDTTRNMVNAKGKSHPFGSYRDSCTECRVIDRVLLCMCKTMGLNVKATQLDLSKCVDIHSINNCNGDLKCEKCN